MQHADVALGLIIAVAVVGATVTAGAGTTGAINSTARPTAETNTQAQEERLDNGTALTKGDAGKFVSGREDDEDQVFPGNLTFNVKNNKPGASTGFALYASGTQENVRLHWNILYQPDFDWSSCGAGNAAAYGFDRGNNDSGTTTDVSLLSAAKTLQFEDDGIYTGYYKEEQLAGSPINFTVDDQVIASLNDCQQNPSEPGWYRVYARTNGSTKIDAKTDFAVAPSDYTYICEGCDSYQDAVEKLGPEPTTCPPKNAMPEGSTGLTDKEWLCRSNDGEYYKRGEDPSGDGSGSTATATPGGGETATPTATPGSGGTATPAATATPTPTATASPAQQQTERQQNNQQQQTEQQQTEQQQNNQQQQTEQQQNNQQQQTERQQNNQQQQTEQQQNNQQQQDSGVVTPTAGSGPGFGAVAALGGLLATGLLARRRD
jgi:PGF-CTERM protein